MESRTAPAPELEVFMYVKLNALIRVRLEHADLQAAKRAAQSICWEIEDELDLTSIERRSCQGLSADDLEIEEVELVEVTADVHDPAEPQFYALKVNGVFVEGDPDNLPKDCR